MLHSLDTREAVEDYLSSPPGDQLGLGVQGMLTLLRVVWTVTAVSGAAAAILGWYALHRSKGARLALSGLAVPLFVTSFFFVGLPGASAFPAMVTAAIVMLWFQPVAGLVRRHHARRRPRRRPRCPRRRPRRPAGTRCSTSRRRPRRRCTPRRTPPQPTASVAPPARRPASVTWACVLAWLSTAAVFGMLGLVLVVMLASPDALIEAAHRENPDLADQGMTDADAADEHLRRVRAWSWRGRQRPLRSRCSRGAGSAGRPLGLAVSAGLASLLCLLSVVGALVVMLVPLAACAATVALLLRPESLAWFRARHPA